MISAKDARNLVKQYFINKKQAEEKKYPEWEKILQEWCFDVNKLIEQAAKKGNSRIKVKIPKKCLNLVPFDCSNCILYKEKIMHYLGVYYYGNIKDSFDIVIFSNDSNVTILW